MSRNSCPHLSHLAQIVPAELCQQKKVTNLRLMELHGKRKKFDCITALALLAATTTSGERQQEEEKMFIQFALERDASMND